MLYIFLEIFFYYCFIRVCGISITGVNKWQGLSVYKWYRFNYYCVYNCLIFYVLVLPMTCEGNTRDAFTGESDRADVTARATMLDQEMGRVEAGLPSRAER